MLSIIPPPRASKNTKYVVFSLLRLQLISQHTTNSSDKKKKPQIKRNIPATRNISQVMNSYCPEIKNHFFPDNNNNNNTLFF